MKRMLLKFFAAAVPVAVILAGLPLRADSHDDLNPGVWDPDSVPYGKMYGEWGGEWWNWAYHEPVATHPLWDETGAFGHLNQAGPVWFLAGNRGGTSQRSLTMPPGKALFFPVINYGARAPVHGNTEEALRARANSIMDQAAGLAVSVDGVALQDLVSYRAESPPGGYTLRVPEGSFLTTQAGYAPGDYLGVTDGYWIMLEPLSTGQHEVRFSGGVPAFGFALDVTYNLNVVPEPSALGILGAGALGLIGLIGCCALRRRGKRV